MINPIYGNNPIPRINGVRGYTKEQQKRIIESAEQESQIRMEVREYLKNFQNPENLSFAELLDEARKES